MSSSRHPIDLVQPFEIHPLGCDCAQCEDAVFAPSLTWSFLVSVVLALGGILTGFFIGWALNASGFLSLIGIG